MKNYIYLMNLVQDFGYEGIEVETLFSSKDEEKLKTIKSTVEEELGTGLLEVSKEYLTDSEISDLNDNYNKGYLEIVKIKII